MKRPFFLTLLLILCSAAVNAQECEGDSRSFTCSVEDTFPEDVSQGVLIEISPDAFDFDIEEGHFIEDYYLTVTVSFTDSDDHESESMNVIIRSPDRFLRSFETTVADESQSQGHFAFNVCPVSNMTALVTASAGAAGAGFVIELSYRFALLEIGDTVSSNLQDYLEMFIFDVNETVADQFSIAITMHAPDNEEEVPLLLSVRADTGGCPQESTMTTPKIGLAFLTWSKQARLILSGSSHPSLTEHALLSKPDNSDEIGVGRWYASVLLRDDVPANIPFSITVDINSSYNDDDGMIAFMTLVPFAIALFVIISVRLSARYEIFRNCQLRFQPRVEVEGKVYRFRSRQQSWKDLLKSWFIGGDPDVEIQIFNGEKTHIKNRRPFSFSWLTIIVGMAFGISTMQFIYANWARQQLDGTRDICFYNEMCSRPRKTWDLPWNNLVSNGGFVVLGLMFNLDIALHERYDRAGQDHSLLYALGWALIGEGFYSASYHICPTPEIFQFDTAFMFAIASLSIIALAQTGESKDSGIKAIKFFMFFYVPLLFFNYIGVLIEGSGQETFSVTFVRQGAFYVFFMLWLTLIMSYTFTYFFRDKCSSCEIFPAAVECKQCPSVISKWCNECSDLKHTENPSHEPEEIPPARKRKTFWGFTVLVILLYIAIIMKATNYIVVPFANLMLGVLVGSLLIYLAYKLCLYTFKHRRREGESFLTRNVYLWSLFVTFVCIGAYAATLFLAEVTDKTLASRSSRNLNKECIWFDYFDTHDAWHFFAGIAVTCVLCLILHLNPPVNRDDYREGFQDIFEVDEIATLLSPKRKASVEFKDEEQEQSGKVAENVYSIQHDGGSEGGKKEALLG